MVEQLTDNLGEFDRFVAGQTNGHIMQTSLWPGVKSCWEHHAFIVRGASGEIISGMSILMRKLPYFGFSLAYAPRGPVYDTRGESSLTELLAGVKQFCKAHGCCSLICDPYIRKNQSHFHNIAAQLGFRTYDSAVKFDNVQPQFVMSLDIKDKTADELLASFNSKTRYNLRLAGRKGVTVSVCGTAHLDDFYSLMLTTGKRDHFTVRPKAYFEKLLTQLGNHARLYMAFYEGTAIAGTIAVQYGNKVSYVYGASADIYRNLMPNYLLQWDMMKWGLETGCEEYDFGGVAGDLDETNPLYGLYKFKKGFNSELTQFVGEYRYDFKPLVYPALKLARTLYLRLTTFLRKVKNRGDQS